MTSPETTKRAVILLSGGLDSCTTLAIAHDLGFVCYALSFDYGQRHRAELLASEKIASALAAIEHKTIKLDLGQIGGSALTDPGIDVPINSGENAIPVTYVPARNTIFLAMALGWAEVLEADDIFIGVNAVDYSGYPDCRPEFIRAFEQVARLATRAGVEGHPIRIHTPLIDLTKAQIIQRGIQLGVDYSLTVSCYQADNQGRACGQCDSCHFRSEGFRTANVPDPTHYLKLPQTN